MRRRQPLKQRMRKSVVMPPLLNLLPLQKPKPVLKQKPPQQQKPKHVKKPKPPLLLKLLPLPLLRQAQKRKQGVKRWIDG